MDIIRAGLNDTDVFSKNELDFGACCFYSSNKKYKYFFQIKGRGATLYSNTKLFIFHVIEEFLFYSSFITSIKDDSGHTLLTRTPNEPYLCEISKIQPSQFYINEKKLESCKKWITKPEDIYVPIIIKDNKIISLDGHTRMRAALDLNYHSIYVYIDEYDKTIFNFVDEAIKRNINTVYDMKIMCDEDYEIMWNKFCDDF